MSSSQNHESAFDVFTDSTYFDDIVPSADVPLPSIECADHLPDNFFDSAFDFGLDTEGFHADMSIWPAGELSACVEDLPAGPVEMASSPPGVTGVLPVPFSPPSSGSIEALWRPLMDPSSLKVSLSDPPTPSRVPTKPRAPKSKPAVSAKAAPKPKVSKVKKTVKPAKAHKRTVSAPSGTPRSVEVLYSLPWSHLSQEEKGLLLLPLLQGIDPTTGLKINEAGSLLPPPKFEMIREDIFGTGDDGANLVEEQSPSFASSPAAKTTIGLTGDSVDVNDEDAAVFRACQAFNVQHDLKKKNSLGSISDFNFDIPDFKFDESNWNIFDDFMPADQGLGGSCGNGVIGNSDQKSTSSNVNGNLNSAFYVPETVGDALGQIPTLSGEYGRKRQQEALQRNAMLRAAGRRR